MRKGRGEEEGPPAQDIQTMSFCRIHVDSFQGLAVTSLLVAQTIDPGLCPFICPCGQVTELLSY